MRFKKGKQQVLSDLMTTINTSTYVDLGQLKYKQAYEMEQYAKQQIQYAISSALQAAFAKLLDEIYTDEEFERDIGLENNQ